jgi:phosphate transport system substrate-binding protein
MACSEFTEACSSTKIKPTINALFMKKILSLAVATLLLSACKKTEDVGPQVGSATILTDEAHHEVVDALTETYQYRYPEVKFKHQTGMEDVILADFLNGKADILSMGRELDAKEKALLKQNLGVDWKPAKFAADAVVFVVNKNDPRESIDVKEIEQGLKTANLKLIADAGNGSNINTLCRYFKMPLSEAKFTVIKGNLPLAKYMTQHPGVGMISLNSISRPHNEAMKTLRAELKILPVTKQGKSHEASLQNLQQNNYPFTKILYFITKEHHFGLCNGFIRFSCTQLGQIVVSKQGIQPYYRYHRQVLLQ